MSLPSAWNSPSRHPARSDKQNDIKQRTIQIPC